MRLILTALLALACGVPAARADLAEEYGAAHRFLGETLTSRDAARQIEAVATLIAALEGRWIQIGAMADGRSEMPGPEAVARFCTNVAYDLAAAGPLSFTMTLRHKRGEMRTLFIYGGRAGLFHSSTPVAEMLAWLLADPDKARPDVVASLLRSPERNGAVTVLHPSPDILILLAEGEGAGIWGRCP